MNPIIVNDSDLRCAAAEGMDAFLDVFVNAYKAACGSELSAEAFGLLTPDQITLWGYAILREEVMDGGFVQLIHNGYGPFFFHNPFAKALKLWGVDDLARLIRPIARKRSLWRFLSSIPNLTITTTHLSKAKSHIRRR